ncbi:ImmA/IrrE family metallo-endopeptidase [Clostridium sp.]|uniref:ImmA/IrrE family metallo-endopeptidase n=1 Tax=Clostridium sp. TaxID=1506 RepID=UPI0026355FEC|nr:ImmA/IrrE family metallo-endopeptidase [Clostridium sp.]
MTYEKLLEEYEEKLKTKELPLKYNLKGLYRNGKILIDSNMNDTEKRCILAEEIGHYCTSYGNILNQDNINNKKQEVIARRWGYEKLIGIVDLVNAFNRGITGRYELAEALNVTESFLEESIEYYKVKYGPYYEIDTYLVYFYPTFGVMNKY